MEICLFIFYNETCWMVPAHSYSFLLHNSARLCSIYLVVNYSSLSWQYVRDGHRHPLCTYPGIYLDLGV